MYLVLFVASVLLGCTRSANVHKHMKMLSQIDNAIENNVIVPTKQTGPRKFLTIAQKPLANYTHSRDEVLELTCDAIGSPAPSIHWFKNDAPVFEYDVESNELIDSNPSSLARVISTLLVTRTVQQDVYTCVVTAGAKTARATTVVYKTDGSSQLSERAKLYPLQPRIVVTYETFVDNIGNNVVLPCRVKGHPKPRVVWMDNKGDNVKSDPRMKVLRSGELVISSLRWSDMGEFTCYATNVFGSQLAKTFVYPARYDVESNELIDSNPSSLARVISTLLVTRTVQQDVYTCVVTAGAKTARATTVVYKTDGSSQLSERAKLYPLQPRIVVTYETFVDNIGNNVVLPCRVKGHPKPRVVWMDNKGDNVKSDPRMKVLRSGELVISSLRWSDMGEFTCYATNVFGSQLAKTFVYPARAG